MERKPRPQGSTYLSQRYQESGTNEDKETLIKHLITIYTLHGFSWNNKPCSIHELAQILKIPPQVIMAQISNLGQNIGSLASPENIKNTLQSIITLSTTWAIQDRGTVNHQLSNLLQSQKGTYKPFITAEVNKTLKLMLESNKNLMDSYKTFFTQPNNITNILNIIKPEDKDYLSPDEALKMIEQENKRQVGDTMPENEGKGLADQLREEYGIEQLNSVFGGASEAEGLIALKLPDAQAVKAPQSLPAEEPESDKASRYPSRRREPFSDQDEIA